MTLGDNAIVNCFNLLTDISASELEQIKQKMQNGENPMNFKKLLAFTITKQFNTQEEAEEAQAAFEKTVQGGEAPAEIPVFPVTRKTWVVLDLLMQSKMITSRSEGRRLLDQKAVEIDGKVIEPGVHELMINNGNIVRVGKRKYIKIQMDN
jgi:tyrosyl-tRNA synthetase